MKVKRNAAAILSGLDTDRWLDEELAGQLRWFEGKGTKLTPEQVEAYRAGYSAGFRKLRALLALHLGE